MKNRHQAIWLKYSGKVIVRQNYDSDNQVRQKGL